MYFLKIDSYHRFGRQSRKGLVFFFFSRTPGGTVKYHKSGDLMKIAYRRCLFRLLVGCRVWVLPHGPFSGATAYCTIGSSLWKKLLQPLNDFREHSLDLLSGSHCLWWMWCFFK